MISVSRRDFLLLLVSTGAAHSLPDSWTTAGPTLRVILPDDGRAGAVDARRGAAMAVEEAERAAAMFGGSIALGDGPGISVAIGGLPQDRVHGVYMNVLDGDPSALTCRRDLFHVAPSNGGVAWLPTLSRFGADTLNKRYRARYDAPMTAPAWCGWFAVKSAWEGALKSRASDPASLIAHLQSAAARFDGHKGVALYFDAANQLVQPTYDPSGNDAFQFSIERKCIDWK